MGHPCQNFFWNTFWGIFADRLWYFDGVYIELRRNAQYDRYEQVPCTSDSPVFLKKRNAIIKKFIYILGPTGFDSETNGIVSMPSAGVQLVNIILHTFNWR